MAVLLKCPDCEEKFKWNFTDERQWPRHCPLCGSNCMACDRPDDEVVMPAFLSPRSKANDKVYRDMESGSERRAELAAEAAGCSVSDMSSLKITDMNDRKDCEIAAKEVSNPVTSFMAQTGIGGFKGPDGVGYSGAVQSGPLPNAGAKMRTFLQSQHAITSQGSAVSDRPGLETQQPGYRRRG